MTAAFIIERAKAVATLDATRERIDELQCGTYCDPGYDSQKGVILGNWNGIREITWIKGQGHIHTGKEDNTIERLGSILEKAGYQTDWSDEYTTCDDCGGFFRTSPDSYSWKQYGEINDNGCICGKCLGNNTDDYLADRINNPSNAVNTDLIDLSAEGFTKVNDYPYQNGLHEGMNDDPKKVLDKLQAEYPSREFVFTYEPSQFYVKFDVWSRETEQD